MLSPRQLGVVAQLNKYWHQMSEDDRVWRHLCLCEILSSDYLQKRDLNDYLEKAKKEAVVVLKKHAKDVTMKDSFRFLVINNNSWEADFNRDIKVSDDGLTATCYCRGRKLLLGSTLTFV